MKSVLAIVSLLSFVVVLGGCDSKKETQPADKAAETAVAKTPKDGDKAAKDGDKAAEPEKKAEKPAPVELKTCGTTADCPKGKKCQQLPDLSAQKCMGELDYALECEKWKECKTHGKCGAVDWQCAPTVVAHCEASQECKEYQRCGIGKGKYGPRCVVTDAACKMSPNCAAWGRCAALPASDGYPSWCAPGSAEDCKNSQGCKDNGKCTYKKGEQACQ